MFVGLFMMRCIENHNNVYRSLHLAEKQLSETETFNQLLNRSLNFSLSRIYSKQSQSSKTIKFH